MRVINTLYDVEEQDLTEELYNNAHFMIVYAEDMKYEGFLFGTDEMFEYNSDYGETEFYQLFALDNGKVMRFYYEYHLEEDGDLGGIDYYNPHRAEVDTGLVVEW